MEKAKGTADMQSSLASAQVKVEISKNEAMAKEAAAGGEAAFISTTGKAEGEKIAAIGLANASAKQAYVLAVAKGAEALGLARARGYEEQVRAVGVQTTGLVAVANAISEGKITVMPEILVNGGGGAGEGLAATLMGWLKSMGSDVNSSEKLKDEVKEVVKQNIKEKIEIKPIDTIS